MAIDLDALREGLNAPDPAYVLVKRGLYWRPNGHGYTGLLREAGLYSAEDAAGHVDHGAPSTKATLASEAPEFAPECWPETKVKVLLADRAAARAEADQLRSDLIAKAGRVEAAETKIERLRAALERIAKLTRTVDAPMALMGIDGSITWDRTPRKWPTEGALIAAEALAATQPDSTEAPASAAASTQEGERR